MRDGYRVIVRLDINARGVWSIPCALTAETESAAARRDATLIATIVKWRFGL